ncbi:hypothetical protein [Parvularcula marina]|uniref:CC0125/CC1285 family lipoprotein n=1 Tax=Parvularcula marina TaxID=2292771 RepID=UPI0035121625
MNKILIAALTLFGLAACASTTSVYGPATDTGFGYRDQQIEADRYRVSYRGRDMTSADDGALRRAAEIATREGATWFRVVSRDVETPSGRSSGTSIGIGGATGGRNSSVGVGVRLPLGDNGPREAVVRLEILLGEGDMPGDEGVYDARQVLGNLGGTTVGESALDG